MYDPKGNGRARDIPMVQFTEAEPPGHLQGIVHRFLELKTTAILEADYRFHALPDACAYVVFDQSDPAIAGVSQLRAQSEEFNLGRQFHFVNIRFLPGVWHRAAAPLSCGIIDTPYGGDLPLRAVNRALRGCDFAGQQPILAGLVEDLLGRGLVAPNPVTDRIFRDLDAITSVADMARICGLSPRHLQRVLKHSTGFAPHDFLKVLRLQQSLNGTDTWSYADQSHFIHSFRRATGYTPGRYSRKFDT